MKSGLVPSRRSFLKTTAVMAPAILRADDKAGTKLAVVVKATLDGEEVFSLGYPEMSDPYKPGADGKKIKYSPTNLAIAPNGDFYVGDGYGSSYINQYNAKGEYIRTFGGKGKDPGQL